MFQGEGTTCIKAPLWDTTWHIQGKERLSVWLKQSEKGTQYSRDQDSGWEHTTLGLIKGLDFKLNEQP